MKSNPKPPRATYQDVIDAPADRVCELIEGRLYTSPRPAAFHSTSTMRLGVALSRKYQFDGDEGPGGWWLATEPELHFGSPEPVLVPDLAGWRIERLPHVPTVVGVHAPPNWVCELLSPSTKAYDRDIKMPIYAHYGIGHLWLIDPATTELQAFELRDELWHEIARYQGDVHVRVVPFEAVELDLARILRSDI